MAWFCHYCGNKPCDIEKHNPRQVRDLLIDAGILDESDEQWHAWLSTKLGTNAIDIFFGFDTLAPIDLYNIYHPLLAQYARSIL